MQAYMVDDHIANPNHVATDTDSDRTVQIEKSRHRRPFESRELIGWKVRKENE